MKFRLLVPALLVLGLFAGPKLQAQTIDLFEVYKVQNFLQNSSATPAPHVIIGAPGGQFNFGAVMSGSSFNLISGGPTLVLPNSTQQAVFDLDPGYYDYYGIKYDYSTKAAMDAAYPGGSYSFKFTAPGGQLGQPTNFSVSLSLGPVDQYPVEIPQVTNGAWDAQGNLKVNASANVTLTFNNYSGYTTGAGGIIGFDIYGLSGTTLISNPFDASSTFLSGLGADPAMTSCQITANTLQANQIYYAELSFVRAQSLSQDYKEAVSLPIFEFVTGIMISTYPDAVAPAITTQPVGLNLVAGATAQFTAAASGTPAPTYQWQKNSVNIAGATGSTLTIVGVTSFDAGDYRVVATNSAGNATSNAATLTIAVVKSDFNGDARADLVWENTSTGERYLWLMNDTAFTSSVSLGTMSTDWHIAATGDFNGDGRADLVWENTSTGERYVWLMNGTGFSSSVFLGVISTEWRIATTGDFNGDGKSDLVWQNTVTGERYVWLMNGTTFSSSVYLGVIGSEWRIAGSGDFNGDGKADLVWENTQTGERYVWLMNGTTFSSSAFLGVVSTQWQIAGSADFNHDGRADLVWQNTSTGERYVWLMNGTSFNTGVSLGSIGAQWRISL